MILKFKRKIAGLLLLLYIIVAMLILFILNFSYAQNQKESISRILNMKFQMTILQKENVQKEIQDVKSAQEKTEKSETPKRQNDQQILDSYINKSYLVVKDSDGKFYAANVLPDSNMSEAKLLKIAKNILETGGKSGNYKNYQYEITVGGDELLIGFADVTAVKKREQKYLLITMLIALAGCGIWAYPAWKVAGHMVAPMEEAIRLQSEFVMFAGHELKTPVTVMKASLDMLRKDGVCSKYLDYVEEENEKMKKLIIELLDYSKLDLQKKDIQMERVNASECLESTALEFEVIAFEKGVQLSEEIEDNIIIIGNAEKLQRMTETLIENAVRHTKEEKEIRVSLKREEKKVRLSIANQGKEIPENERIRIFEKFYQSSDSEANHYGLGLAIAQMIAGQHHTEIQVICKDGWNQFEIEFPAL